MTLYSERLAKCVGAGATVFFTIPAGKRCVFKQVACSNWAASTANIYLEIGNCTIVDQPVPARPGSVVVDLFQVAYAGEVCNLQTVGTNLDAMVSGYLLTES